VVRGVTPRPRRIVLYGTHGIGKSTWASKAPSPIFVPTEDGLEDIGADRFPVCRSLGDFNTAISQLLTEQHDYATVVIDTLDWLEKLVWQTVAAEEGKSHIEEIGFAKGYKYASSQWDFILNSLEHLRKQRRMAIILLAHAKIERFNSPDSEPFDRYDLDLHKFASATIQEWADEVLFARYQVFTMQEESKFNGKRVRGVGGKDRIIHTCEEASHVAKRRIPMPDVIPMEFAEYAKYVMAAKPRKADVEEAAAVQPGQPGGDIAGIVNDGSSKTQPVTVEA